MITSDAWRGKRYAVLGLARSGRATVRALLASGAEVVAWDAREEARAALTPSPSAAGAAPPSPARGEGLEWHDAPPSPLAGEGNASEASEGEGVLSFTDPLTIPLTNFDAVIVSPGVPLNRHPIAAHARKHGVPIIGDIELFAQARPGLPPHKVVGITGTNGKSTTTALVHHILKTAGKKTTMGGNIGLPILGQEPLPRWGIYVLELSSFQIDLTNSLDCDVATILNVTPDHLDRYDGFDAYAEAKMRLFRMSTHVTFDMRVYRNHCDNLDQTRWPALQGPHNFENATAADTICQLLGIDQDAINRGLESYPGLPHRMERVCELNGVLYVNDSKATNATSAAPALAAYPAVHWILGGQAKTNELDACAPHFGHVRAAYTIGEAGPMFAGLLRPHIKVTESETLARAVDDASKAAVAGETVLLSPACASFDQFRDFEARGDAFRAAVGALQ